MTYARYKLRYDLYKNYDYLMSNLDAIYQESKKLFKDLVDDEEREHDLSTEVNGDTFMVFWNFQPYSSIAKWEPLKKAISAHVQGQAPKSKDIYVGYLLVETVFMYCWALFHMDRYLTRNLGVMADDGRGDNWASRYVYLKISLKSAVVRIDKSAQLPVGTVVTGGFEFPAFHIKQTGEQVVLPVWITDDPNDSTCKVAKVIVDPESFLSPPPNFPF